MVGIQILILTLISHSSFSQLAIAATSTLPLYYGYVTKISCLGRVVASSVGNEELVRLEPLPAAIGCGVILKPVQKSGFTNLIIETSTGTIHRTIKITTPSGFVPTQSDLITFIKVNE
jgi:hypothetical protein